MWLIRSSHHRLVSIKQSKSSGLPSHRFTSWKSTPTEKYGKLTQQVLAALKDSSGFFYPENVERSHQSLENGRCLLTSWLDRTFERPHCPGQPNFSWQILAGQNHLLNSSVTCQGHTQIPTWGRFSPKFSATKRCASSCSVWMLLARRQFCTS